MSPEWGMGLFWGIASLFVVAAVAIVLLPLLRCRDSIGTAPRQAINIAVYRDQLQELERDRADGLLDEENYASARRELEARLAQDALQETDTAPVSKGGRRLGYALGVAIPAAAFGLYMLLGNPDTIHPAAVAQSDGPHAHDIAAMVKALEEKVEANPGDAKQRLLLAKTYAALERWTDAVKMYAQASRLAPNEAAVWSGYAEALGIANGRRDLKGEPIQMVHKALELDPNDPKGLELAGIHAFLENNFTLAAHYWKQLLKQLPAESAYAQEIAAAMQEAKSRAEAAFGQSLDKLVPEDPRIAAMSIRGRLEVSPKLKGKFPADATVFLFARPVGGKGPPVAAIKARAGSLPLDFELNDSMAMNPQMKLSDHQEVAITARISVSGQPAATSGDLEGTLSPVKLGSKDVKLVIDTVRP